MEKFMQRENVLMEYNPQGLSANSPKTPCRSSEDMDFNDVFGGPPRRFSMQEVKLRYSFGDQTVESEEERALSPWSSLKEKPVFGEESLARRRHQGDDFFDDIFKGDESYGSPRRTDRDRDNLFGSSPGSRIMSPARPLPPKAEPFGTSLPAQFSLPAKLTKAMELPTFSPRNHSEYTANGLKSSHSSSSLSRFSNQAIRGQDEIRNEVHLQSPLSHEASFSSEDSPSTFTSDQKDNVENLKKDASGNQFHFSIYKWAGRGVPMLMPLLAVNNSKKDIKYDTCASSRGRMESDYMESIPSTLVNQGLSAKEPESLKIERDKKDSRSKEGTKELQNSIEETLYGIPELKSQSSTRDTVVFGEARQDIKEEQVNSLDKIDMKEKIEKEVPPKKEESLKSEVKPLRALFTDEVEQPGNITEMKKSNKTRTPKGAQSNERDSKNKKKIERTRIDSKSSTVDKSSFQVADVCSGETPAKSGVKGKVREFVQIFNQETDSRPKADVQTRSQSFRWKPVGIEENEVSLNAAKVKERVILHKVDKKPDVSLKVDENLNKDDSHRQYHIETPDYTSNHPSTNQKNEFSSESLQGESKLSVNNSDDPLEDNFLVEELSDDHEKVTQSGEGSEDMKALDAKIRQWAVGKKGNIRSLLSTLQFVLWPGSGWKPVPLAELIEANAVKRAYQKALLRLHPDKLQQKGAAFQQKYMAEKIFDILQEAWDHFNTFAPL